MMLEAQTVERRRSRMQMIEDVLRITNKPEGVCATHIVYGSNMNFNKFTHLRTYLMEKGLIEESSGNYTTTSNGRDFLKKMDELNSLL